MYRLNDTEYPSYEALQESFDDKSWGDVLVGETTFAKIYEKEITEVRGSSRGGRLKRVFSVDEGCHNMIFDSEEELEDFKQLDVGVREYGNYKEGLALAELAFEKLPDGDLTKAMLTATAVVARKQLDYIRKRRLEPGLEREELDDLLRSQRDLNHALAGVASSLDLYSESGTTPVQEPYDTFSWYLSGRITRGGGYVAEYNICNDEFYYDEIDHKNIIDEINESDDYAPWPDEFHHPGKMEIRVDPKKRIEFVYTPGTPSARARHFSRSEVSENGKTRYYNNNALSIRLDLDPYAPNGIALDIGRSPHDHERDGRLSYRTGDLLGSVMAEASPTGSHEYAGFAEGMTENFRNYAERLAIWLLLQNKAYLVDRDKREVKEKRKRELARSATRGEIAS